MHFCLSNSTIYYYIFLFFLRKKKLPRSCVFLLRFIIVVIVWHTHTHLVIVYFNGIYTNWIVILYINLLLCFGDNPISVCCLNWSWRYIFLLLSFFFVCYWKRTVTLQEPKQWNSLLKTDGPRLVSVSYFPNRFFPFSFFQELECLTLPTKTT